ncbi:MAG: protein kinase [Gemmatales bacterium]|nr:protein kinase [Gemmatales bacterium]MDW8388125.1 protein kinase [Gemmatales bacterium]
MIQVSQPKVPIMNAQPPDLPNDDEKSLSRQATTLWQRFYGQPKSGTAAETPEDHATVSLAAARSDEEPTVRKGDSKDTQAIPTRLAHYEIVSEIARGGMGVVYEARDQKLNRLVALKVLRTSLSATDEGVLRFQREAQAAARLNHPHIVPIHDFGREGSFLFYTMALIDGRTLSSCRDRYTRDIRAAVDLVRKAALAVAYAHEQGILHRDLKPSNILVDATGEPRVADFGLAKFFDQPQGVYESSRSSKLLNHAPEISQAGQVVGTPAYMAPEQFKERSAKLGPACDVWALGIILYELLGGVRPFRGATTPAVRNAVLYDEPRRLRKLNPRIDPGLEAVVMKCLEKNPADRFASARELAEELERWLNDQPLRTKPRKWTDRARRYVQRRWAVLTVALALIVGSSLAAAGIPFTFVPSEDISANQEALNIQGNVEIVGPVGPPKAFTFPRGEAGVNARPNKVFSVHSLNDSLVELLPGPMPASFLFEAELQQINANLMGTYGLYLARIEPNEPGCDWLLRISLADIGGAAANLRAPDGTQGGWVRLERVYYKPLALGVPGVSSHKLALEHFWLVPPNPWTDTGPWRNLMVQVEKDNMSFHLDGQQAFQIDKQQLQQRSSEVAEMHGDKHPPLLWPTEGGLGIYVSRCAVRIRNVRLQRLD